MKSRSAKLFIFSMFVIFMGCQPVWHPVVISDTDDSLPKRVENASDSVMIKQMTELQRRGVVVITMGQDYLVSIPSSHLFANQSPRLLWSAYDTLNYVVAFLGQFRKIAVNVTAYGDYRSRSERRELALTKARAETVANYFWSQGVDSRIVFASGAGATQPIVMEGSEQDRLLNSRIEITFRDTVA